VYEQTRTDVTNKKLLGGFIEPELSLHLYNKDNRPVPLKKNEFHNSAALNYFRLSSWGYDTQHNSSIYFIVLSRLVISPADSEIGMNLLVAVFLFLCFRNLFCSENAQWICIRSARTRPGSIIKKMRYAERRQPSTQQQQQQHRSFSF
jgi:hypothetical protein